MYCCFAPSKCVSCSHSSSISLSIVRQVAFLLLSIVELWALGKIVLTRICTLLMEQIAGGTTYLFGQLQVLLSDETNDILFDFCRFLS